MSERLIFFRLGVIAGVLLVAAVVTLTWLMTGQLPDYCS